MGPWKVALVHQPSGNRPGPERSHATVQRGHVHDGIALLEKPISPFFPGSSIFSVSLFRRLFRGAAVTSGERLSSNRLPHASKSQFFLDLAPGSRKPGSRKRRGNRASGFGTSWSDPVSRTGGSRRDHHGDPW